MFLWEWEYYFSHLTVPLSTVTLTFSRCFILMTLEASLYH